MSIAVLLSFVLAPLADALSHLRIGRIACVLIAVALAFGILGILGAVIGRQAAQLSEIFRLSGGDKQETGRRKGSALGARMVEKAADALHGLEDNIGKSAVPAPPRPGQGEMSQAVADQSLATLDM
jgi:predicted PurR-regulated permease PerM